MLFSCRDINFNFIFFGLLKGKAESGRLAAQERRVKSCEIRFVNCGGYHMLELPRG